MDGLAKPFLKENSEGALSFIPCALLKGGAASRHHWKRAARAPVADNLAVAPLANSKALRRAAQSAHERGRQLNEMARATNDAAAKRRTQAEVARRRQYTQ